MIKIQPSVVTVFEGRSWLYNGYRLFKKEPSVWLVSLLAYWTAMFLFGLIPILGVILSLILSPGLAFGFISLGSALDNRRPTAPRIIISGFTGSKKSELLILGFFYLLFLALLVLLISLINEKSIIDLLYITEDSIQSAEDNPQNKVSVGGLLISVLLYVPVQMLFWFAPQLVVWGDLRPLKAMFYSFFAVLLNWKGFVLYLFTWAIVLLLSSIAITICISIFKLNQTALIMVLIPFSFVIMAIAQGSYYEITKTIFPDLLKKHNVN